MCIKDAIIDESPGNVYWKDKNGYYLGCNKNFKKVCCAIPIIGKTDKEIFGKRLSEDDLKYIKKVDEKVMEYKSPIVIEERGIDSFGNEAYYLTEKKPLFNGEGKVIGIIGTSIDITNKKKLQSSNKDKKKMLEKIAADISHDVITPLSGICSTLELIKHRESKRLDEESIELISGSLESSKELIGYVRSITTRYAKNDELKHENKFSVFNLLNSLKAMVCPYGSDQVLIDLPIDLKKDYFFGFEHAIKKVLINFVFNAINFSPKGYNIILRAYKKNVFEHQTKIVFEVQDHGIGIDEVDIPYIFDKFYRCTRSYTGLYKGSGIGLYRAKYIANKINADINVKSKKGEGSIFSVSLLVKNFEFEGDIN